MTLKVTVAIVQSEMTSCFAMSVYGVPKPTTYHKIHRKPKKSPGGQTSFTNEEEQLFIDHLIKVSD